MEKPVTKPNNPNFSSGPCTKRPDWSLNALEDAFLGRSHRAGGGKAKLKDVIELHREILGIPDDYKIGIVPASDTGAVEMAMWSMLGGSPNNGGVDVLAWESFSSGWLSDITKQLKLDNVTAHEAEYGDLPDLSAVNFDNDVVFCWNGTTSGVRVPNADWVSPERTGLTICDATSAVFAYDMDWSKLDVTTWSWQKVLGSEAAHGMIVLSPRAVERLETYTPENRPLPKIFRMTKKGKLIDGVFVGETINTPSMLAVEDCLDALKWVKSIGGQAEMAARTQRNYEAIRSWVQATDWAEFLAHEDESRSYTSICIKITDDWFTAQDENAQAAIIAAMCKTLDKEGVAYDIKGYRDAPAGLRIWCGATVETTDVEALCPWLEWAYENVKMAHQARAA